MVGPRTHPKTAVIPLSRPRRGGRWSGRGRWTTEGASAGMRRGNAGTKIMNHGAMHEVRDGKYDAEMGGAEWAPDGGRVGERGTTRRYTCRVDTGDVQGRVRVAKHSRRHNDEDKMA